MSDNNFLDIFNDDAFSMLSLTAAINNIDHVPGRAGDLVFTGENVGEGVPALSVAIEWKGENLSVIPTSTRGGPAPKELQDKANLLKLDIPHIKLEDTISAAQVQAVAEFSTGNLRSPINVVTTQMIKMARRHDMTLEHHRLGALKGQIKDADGSTLTDLFSAFQILNSDGFPLPETFNFNLDSTGVGFADSLRVKCQQIKRTMFRLAKMKVPDVALPWAFCGDEFFDKLITHPSVKETYDGFGAAQSILRKGGNYAFSIFEYGGIMFENYRGTDDQTTVAIADDECRFFLTGVPGLYVEYFAPADFLETVNTPGLPRYAKIAIDRKFQRSVELHTQQNPLPVCLRPQTLMRGTVA